MRNEGQTVTNLQDCGDTGLKYQNLTFYFDSFSLCFDFGSKPMWKVHVYVQNGSKDCIDLSINILTNVTL